MMQETKRCGVCGVKFAATDNHVSGSKDCYEWKHDHDFHKAHRD